METALARMFRRTQSRGSDREGGMGARGREKPERERRAGSARRRASTRTRADLASACARARGAVGPFEHELVGRKHAQQVDLIVAGGGQRHAQHLLEHAQITLAQRRLRRRFSQWRAEGRRPRQAAARRRPLVLRLAKRALHLSCRALERALQLAVADAAAAVRVELFEERVNLARAHLRGACTAGNLIRDAIVELGGWDT
eukprot:6210951-Pleurochrysis_carterae.AAC.2